LGAHRLGRDGFGAGAAVRLQQRQAGGCRAQTARNQNGVAGQGEGAQGGAPPGDLAHLHHVDHGAVRGNVGVAARQRRVVQGAHIAHATVQFVHPVHGRVGGQRERDKRKRRPSPHRGDVA
jgi:hypothetical protein